MCRPGSRGSPGTRIRGRLVDGVRTPHRQGLLACHRLPGQMPQGEFDRLGLGPQAVSVHDCLEVGVFDLDVCTYSAHTLILHLTCKIRVSALACLRWSKQSAMQNDPFVRYACDTGRV